ncbi:hypothetical protein A1O3_07804 [Capronia epimyces CBS 606.96]|uniref:Zn(2)-C6 fungal-type domain-containing protein n=1 Tax=Capronia epimyces CBS 606.96 TaxID=1182542 RepID=W9XQC5_9EURO|nr:uncharacterized protein A1O3_07804 [Capronia epimyces CBS 606.96]EXJ79525.1 hypothetical protein A1O3_07804 [Capronia epimyces CBS 606.96]
MARRKVDPANRMRVSEACVQCRVSKKRCDSLQPCSKCTLRGIQNSCTFTKSLSSAGPKPATPHKRPPRPQQQQHQPTEARLQPSSGSNRSSGPALERDNNSTCTSSPVDTQEDPPGEARHRTQPRLLNDSRGERVFVGSSASLSFLQFIRDVVAGSMGISDFTHDTENTRMFEAAQSDPDRVTNSKIHIDASTKLQYGQNFCLVTKGLLGFITTQDLPHVLDLDTTVSSQQDTQKAAIANLVLAIGAQCAPASLEQTRIEKDCLASAQAAAYAGMLESPSLGAIKVFLLLGFYMFGACRRNAGFMYLGVAARAAYALGLHSDECCSALPDPTKEQQHLVWMSLVTMDHIVSSILGRATASLLHHNDYNPKQSIVTMTEALGASQQALCANYQLSELVNGIIYTLYKNPSVTTQAADEYLEKLDNWSNALPSSLHLNEAPLSTDHLAWERVCDSLHVSCYYHFAVILVCRPFLISQLLNRLLGNKRSAGYYPSRSSPLENDQDEASLAKKCVTAATYMAQTCSEVLESGFLLESGPILKAWIFVAGLVLGLEMFALDTPNADVEAAFRASRSVLQRLGTRSAQAKHYYDILGYLGSVVIKKREEQASQSGAQSGRRVAKMLNFGSKRSSPVVSIGQDDFAVDPMFDFGDMGPGFGNINNLLFSMQDDLATYDDILLEWNQTSSQF